MSIDDMWDYLLDKGVSEETLQVVTNINGCNVDTMEDILYATIGERSFPDDEDEDEDE